MSQFMLREDRDRVFGQLQALHDLHAAEPDLIIVPGHDAALIDRLVGQRLLTEGFAARH